MTNRAVTWLWRLYGALAIVLSIFQPAMARENAAGQGRTLYNARCYYCHGYDGNGKTVAATYLVPPPRDFTGLRLDTTPRDAMLATVRKGSPGTAMKGFAGILSEDEMAQVVDFIRRDFMATQAGNTSYHTTANGWVNHERYRAAFPFARGEIPLSRPVDSLSLLERRGRVLFLSACVSCHDRSPRETQGPIWEGRPVSYPRNQYEAGQVRVPAGVDAVTSASPYLKHDVRPVLSGLSPMERRGEDVYQRNCAFCHAADGTGKNWIGSFMSPHPRNLTDPAFMQDMTRTRLARTIREGLPETSMPAWKSVLTPADVEAVVAYVGRAFHRVKKE